MCKHSSWGTSQTCALCIKFEKEVEDIKRAQIAEEEQQELRRQKREEKAHKKYLMTRHDKLQKESIEFATRNGDNFTDEELSDIILGTQQINGVYEDVDITYKLAQRHSRTLYSIEWVYKYAWLDNVTNFIKDGYANAWYIRIQKIKRKLRSQNAYIR